jgi:hypothetical protein
VLTAVFGTPSAGLGVALAATLPPCSPTWAADARDPWTSLALMLALAVVVGVVAALWPASGRRASRARRREPSASQPSSNDDLGDTLGG